MRRHKYVTVNGTQRHVYEHTRARKLTSTHEPLAMRLEHQPLVVQQYLTRPFLKLPIRGRWQ